MRWVTRSVFVEKLKKIFLNYPQNPLLSGSLRNMVYCSASKFAVVGMTEALTDEMRREGHTGVKFTYVCPMFVDTGLTKYSIERYVQ